MLYKREQRKWLLMLRSRGHLLGWRPRGEKELKVFLCFETLLIPNVWVFRTKQFSSHLDTNGMSCNSVQSWDSSVRAQSPQGKDADPQDHPPLQIPVVKFWVPISFCPTWLPTGRSQNIPFQVPDLARKALRTPKSTYLLLLVYYKWVELRKSQMEALSRSRNGGDEAQSFQALQEHTTLPVPRTVHQPESSLDFILSEFLWRFHYTDVID